MHLKILGCGTILQSGKISNCSGYLIDNHFLFDCGPGIWKALNKNDIPLAQITHIFFTHFHVDHTSDIGPLLLNRLLISDLKEVPLNILGAPGLPEWYDNLKKLLGHWSEDVNVILTEIDDQPYQTDSYSIIARPTDHTENSVCYRVEKAGTSLFYSGDTGYNNNVIALADRCHLAVIEASNSNETHIEEHLTPALAGKIAAKANVQKLVLTHLYPEARAEDPIGKASSEFSGKIIIAEDDMLLAF
jgi:ribonuclease BN (tRNA processing enzyme)